MKSTFNKTDDEGVVNHKYGYYYALTVHDNTKRWPHPKDYEQFLYQLLSQLPCFTQVNYVFEVPPLTRNKQSGKLHLHGTLTGPKILPLMKSAFEANGMNYKIKPIRKYNQELNLSNWNGYMKKQQSNPEIFDSYMISHFWNMDTQEYQTESIA